MQNDQQFGTNKRRMNKTDHTLKKPFQRTERDITIAGIISGAIKLLEFCSFYLLENL